MVQRSFSGSGLIEQRLDGVAALEVAIYLNNKFFVRLT